MSGLLDDFKKGWEGAGDMAKDEEEKEARRREQKQKQQAEKQRQDAEKAVYQAAYDALYRTLRGHGELEAVARGRAELDGRRALRKWRAENGDKGGWRQITVTILGEKGEERPVNPGRIVTLYYDIWAENYVVVDNTTGEIIQRAGREIALRFFFDMEGHPHSVKRPNPGKRGGPVIVVGRIREQDCDEN